MPESLEDDFRREAGPCTAPSSASAATSSSPRTRSRTRSPSPPSAGPSMGSTPRRSSASGPPPPSPWQPGSCSRCGVRGPGRATTYRCDQGGRGGTQTGCSDRSGVRGSRGPAGAAQGPEESVVPTPFDPPEPLWRPTLRACGVHQLVATPPCASSREARGKEAKISESWNTELRLMPSAVTVKIWRVCSSYPSPTRR